MDMFDAVSVGEFPEKDLAGLIDSQRQVVTPVRGAHIEVITSGAKSQIMVVADGQHRFLYRHVLDNMKEAERIAKEFQRKFDMAARMS